VSLKLLCTIVCTWSAWGTALFAQQPDMRYFVGTWDFSMWSTTNTSDTPDLVATWILEDGLDSALALAGHVVIDGSMFTRELIAYDASTGLYTRTIAASTGSYFLFTSTGWNGDRLIWSGTQHMASGSVDLKEEITRLGADAFTALFYGKDGDGWQLMQTERLRRH
jgi:hypothetical protein